MASVQSGKMIVGLDIGTSKVVALVGEVTADGELDIVGIGTSPSRGLKKGVVVNIESTVQSIQRAIEEAQLMAGCRIHSAFVGIAGNHIRSLNSHGIVAIRDREVSPADLERVEAFRQKWFAGFRTLVRASGDMDAVVSVIDPAWNEVVPTTYLLARDGRMITRIQGKKTRAEFRAAALEALGETPPD